MNVRIEHDRSFIAGCWQPQAHWGNLQMQIFQLRLYFTTQCQEESHINTALQRIYWIIDEALNHTVFVAESDLEIAQMLDVMGCKTTVVPVEATDQIIGMALFAKISAVTRDKLTIQRLDIRTPSSQNIWYVQTDEENLGPLEQDGWWQHGDTDCCGLPRDTSLAVIGPDTWRSLDLAWPDDTSNDAQVVYADFRKDEKQQVRPDNLQ